jgi:hypothetical protein
MLEEARIGENLSIAAWRKHVSSFVLNALLLSEIRQQTTKVDRDANIEGLVEIGHVTIENADVCQTELLNASVCPVNAKHTCSQITFIHVRLFLCTWL